MISNLSSIFIQITNKLSVEEKRCPSSVYYELLLSIAYMSGLGSNAVKEAYQNEDGEYFKQLVKEFFDCGFRDEKLIDILNKNRE